MPKLKYPIEQHADIILNKILDKSITFESEIIGLLDKIHPLHLFDLPYITLKNYQSYQEIPTKISCLYFLLHEKKWILYIGKANDLRQRWAYIQGYWEQNEPNQIHHMLNRCLELGDVRLAWFKIDRNLSTIIEPMLIKKLKPEWNTINKAHLG